jgi:cytochrome oxidase Cu insertion factor (SCO1/SenC/PrrC family)
MGDFNVSMRRRWKIGLTSLVVKILAVYVFSQATKLRQPQKAFAARSKTPDFSLKNQDDQLVTLSKLRGHPVLLVFIEDINDLSA